MTKLSRILASLSVLALAACSAQKVYYPSAVPSAPERIAVAYRSIEVRDVTLPTYSQEQEIYVQGEDGGLRALKGALWADRPINGFTQDLAEALAARTGAQVAAEPWPLRSYPQAAVEVRVSKMLVSAQGRFELAGQYFVAPEAETRAAPFRSFALSVPLPDGMSAQSIARARGQATADLAAHIARNGLK